MSDEKKPKIETIFDRLGIKSECPERELMEELFDEIEIAAYESGEQSEKSNQGDSGHLPRKKQKKPKDKGRG